MEKEETKKVGEDLTNSIEVNNAGVILLYPFMSQLFNRMGYLDNNRSMKEEMKPRAIFLIQYMVFGKEQEYREQELSLNKVIVGWPMDKPLPQSLSLTDAEKDTVAELLKTLRQYWTKMKNTPEEAIREAFLRRRGKLEDHLSEQKWVLTVEEKPYDILIDTVPWSFKMARFPGSNYYIVTKWRDR